MVTLGSTSRNAWRVSADRVDLTRAPRPRRAVEVPAAPQRVAFDLAFAALIVIDMQNDFCHADGWSAGRGRDVAVARRPIAPLAALAPRLRAAGVPIVWVNWGNRPDRANLAPTTLHGFKPTGAETGLGDPLPNGRGHVLQKDSWSAAVVDELAPEAGDIGVDKYRLSGFWDTALDSILRNLDVRTLLFAGVNADQCVACTLHDAAFLGYDCLLLEDAVATSSPDFCLQATLYNVRRCFGFTMTTTDLLAALA